MVVDGPSVASLAELLYRRSRTCWSYPKQRRGVFPFVYGMVIISQGVLFSIPCLLYALHSLEYFLLNLHHLRNTHAPYVLKILNTNFSFSLSGFISYTMMSCPCYKMSSMFLVSWYWKGNDDSWKLDELTMFVSYAALKDLKRKRRRKKSFHLVTFLLL